VHRSAYTATFVAEPGVDGLKAFRALLKSALRRFGLRAVDVREGALDAREDERALAQPGNTTMSEFSKRIRSQKKGFYKVADLEGGIEVTHVISHLDEKVEMFDKTVDILNFVDTGRQFQLNQTNAEFLLDNFGDDPEAWNGKRVTLYLASYEYNRETKIGIRLKLPGAPALGDGQTRGLPAQPAPERKRDLDDEIPF
jgi:hypothetical protein